VLSYSFSGRGSNLAVVTFFVVTEDIGIDSDVDIGTFPILE
jgi:hypothetical protein